MSVPVEDQAGLGIATEIPEDISVGNIWAVLLMKIEQPALFLPGVTDVAFRPSDDGKGTYRVMSVGSLRIIECIHADESILEVNFNVVSDNYEIVNCITTDESGKHKLEFFKRDSKSKERVHWMAPAKVGYARIQQIFETARSTA